MRHWPSDYISPAPPEERGVASAKRSLNVDPYLSWKRFGRPRVLGHMYSTEVPRTAPNCSRQSRLAPN
eukprot:6264649-Alexandrium_andersonii.AAC.1